MAKPWKKQLERLRQNPQDVEALEELEAYLSSQDARAREVITGSTGFFSRSLRWSLGLFLGKLLYRNCILAWDAWSSYFRGEYESTGREPWPEAESRDVFAAMAARFIRVSMVTIILGLLPALLLAFQTVVMLVQIWQVQQANDLNRQQFSVGYKSEMFSTLYDIDTKKCMTFKGKGDDRRANLSTCQHNRPSYAVREAALGLATIARIERAGNPATLPISLGGTMYESISFKLVDFQGVSFRGAAFKASSLEGANLAGADLSNSYMDGVTLDRADLSGADLSGVHWLGLSMRGANLTKVTSKNSVEFFAKIQGAGNTLSDVDLSGAKLSNLLFNSQTLQGVRFTDAACLGCQFNGATLSDVSFKNADLTGANFTKVIVKKGVDFSGAVFKGVTCPDGSKSNAKCSGF